MVRPVWFKWTMNKRSGSDDAKRSPPTSHLAGEGREEWNHCPGKPPHIENSAIDVSVVPV